MEHIAIEFDNGEVKVMSFITEGRGNILPYGATWLDINRGRWTRPCNSDTLADEIIRAFPATDEDGIPRPRVVRFGIVKDYKPVDPKHRHARVFDGTYITLDQKRIKE